MSNEKNMNNEKDVCKIGVYWDFENLHASLYDLKNGKDSYGKNFRQNQAKLIDIKSVLDYIESIGEININRAYSNWYYFGYYQDSLNEAGIDLIQLFPKGSNAKNGADIRLSLDIIEDINQFSYLTHIIVIGNDVDYIGLAQKIKQSGREIIGIGVEQNTNKYWLNACNEFKFYETLIRRAGKEEEFQKNVAKPVESKSIAEIEKIAKEKESAARQLLLQSLRQLVLKRGDSKIPNAMLKGQMIRHDPSFDEGNYNCQTFTQFLKLSPDVVVLIDSDSGGHLKLTDAKHKLFFGSPSKGI
jgi:hypothetical protein